MSRIEHHSEVARRLTRVLVVDDERMVLRATRRLLLSRHPDWDVLAASSGNEALQLLQEYHPVNVLVTDLNMPGMDGLTLLNIAEKCHPDVVRVVHSAHIEAFGRATLRELCFELVAKPAGAHELIATLEAACGSASGSLRAV